MTANELRDLMTRAGIDKKQLAEVLGVEVPAVNRALRQGIADRTRAQKYRDAIDTAAAQQRDREQERQRQEYLQHLEDGITELYNYIQEKKQPFS